MTYPLAVLLGLVQGVAEFLPISSSGHLTLLQYFFGMEQADNLFNILLHFATLLAVCVVYFQDILEMIVEFFRMIGDMFRRGRRMGSPPEARRMILLLIVGTLPLFAVMLVKDQVESLGGYPPFVSCALLITGVILFTSDRMGGGRKNGRNITLGDALLVGVAQGFATVPGLSRSGTTISAGMALGFERRFAVRFSFLLSLPAVLGATLLEVMDAVQAGQTLPEGMLPKYLLGMAVAGVVGYFSIKLLELLASRGRFGAFCYYCWAAGLISLAAYFAGFRLIPAV